MKDATQLAAEMVQDAATLEEQAKRLRQAAGILDGRRKPRKRRKGNGTNRTAPAPSTSVDPQTGILPDLSQSRLS